MHIYVIFTDKKIFADINKKIFADINKKIFADINIKVFAYTIYFYILLHINNHFMSPNFFTNYIPCL